MPAALRPAKAGSSPGFPAEMVVKTRDGRTLKLPVDGAEIVSIEFVPAVAGKQATAQVIAGLWDTTIPGSVRVQLEFEKTATGWSGRFFGRNGWEKMADLVVDPAKGTLSWRRPLAWAGESDQRYTATVSGATMTGTFNGSSPWTGKRASK